MLSDCSSQMNVLFFFAAFFGFHVRLNMDFEVIPPLRCNWCLAMGDWVRDQLDAENGSQSASNEPRLVPVQQLQCSSPRAGRAGEESAGERNSNDSTAKTSLTFRSRSYLISAASVSH